MQSSKIEASQRQIPNLIKDSEFPNNFARFAVRQLQKPQSYYLRHNRLIRSSRKLSLDRLLDIVPYIVRYKI